MGEEVEDLLEVEPLAGLRLVGVRRESEFGIDVSGMCGNYGRIHVSFWKWRAWWKSLAGTMKGTYISLKALSFSGLLISTTATYSCGKVTLKNS